MTKIRSMTRKGSYADDACSRTRIETRNKRVWSDLNHDLLLLVVMQLGVVDFLSFGGVCKSWRSFALYNRKMFMASKQPMSMWISNEANEKYYCNLKDIEGRKFKTILPHFAGRACVALTCGYLVLFGEETKDFWLVNPITRHQLHFPNLPDDYGGTCNLYRRIKVILIYSPSVSGWLLVMTTDYKKIWYSIAGIGVWNHVSTTFSFRDLHAFRGKIYTLNFDYGRGQSVRHLCEIRFGPEPKLIVLETKNFPMIYLLPQFASYGENLYVVAYNSADCYKVYKLDFDEMKWVDPGETTIDEFAFYRNQMGHITAAKQDLWDGACTSGKCRVNIALFWYFPHDCLNVNSIDE